MQEILTDELTSVLKKTSIQELDQYRLEQLSPLKNMDFSSYFLAKLSEMGITRSDVIENSGLEVHYAYQILSGKKHPGRDKILCLCIGAGFSVEETNRALERASTGSLYPKRFRDAIIMISLNQKIRSSSHSFTL